MAERVFVVGVGMTRQVPEARVGLQHNLGLGGAAVVSLCRRDAA